MQNKIIIIAIGLIFVLGLAAYFFFQRSAPTLTPTLNQEFQLPQPPQSPAPEEVLLPEAPTQTQTSTQTEESAAETQPQTQPETQNIVIYTDSGYSPNTLRVKVGTVVTFKNQSSRAMWPASALHPTHAVYSGTSLTEHCPDTKGIAFDACTGIQPGNSWSFTFNKKGTWKYHDHLNPSFTGTIIVE